MQRHGSLVCALVALLLAASVLSPAPASGAPAQQAPALQAGGIAQVRGVAPDPLNVRAEPGLSAPVVSTLAEGTRVKLLEGPKAADGQSWWRLAREDSPIALGWAVGTYLTLMVAPGQPAGAAPTAPASAAPAGSNAPVATIAGLPAGPANPPTGAAAAAPAESAPAAAPSAAAPSTPISAPTRPDVLAVGGGARVQGAGVDGLNLRSAPSTGASVVTVLRDGEQLTILDGPQQAGGYTWWKVSSPSQGLSGWCVGTWLVPAAAPAPAEAVAASGGGPSAAAVGSAANLIKRNSAGYMVGPTAGAGFCVHLYGQDKQRVLDVVKAAGFTWVKQQVEWQWHETSPGQYNWGELDAIVDAVDQNSLGLILSIVKAPSFYRSGHEGHGPPDDPAKLERFLREMSTRYGSKVQAYEIWNEANLAVEWGFGKINAGEFVELLRAGYKGVKEGNPNAVVIMGALTPTGVNDWQVAADDVAYLRQMYAYKGGVVSNYFDALGAHPSGFNNPPDDLPGSMSKVSDSFKGHPSFYFRRVEELYAVMKENGDGAKQVWLTEFGWSSMDKPPAGYEYAAEITEEEQAKFLVRAFERARQHYPWMGVMAVWNLNFQSVVGADDEKWGFGVVRHDLSPRPAFVALAAMPK